MAGGGARALPRDRAARLPRGRDTRRRQDHVRAAHRHRAHRAPHRRPRDRGRTDGSPQAAVGGCRAPGRAAPQSRLQQRGCVGWAAVPRGRGHVRAGGGAGIPAPADHRECSHARDPRRGAPRRRRAELGRRDPRGVRAGRAAAVADRHAVPQRHGADPVRRVRAERQGHPHLAHRLQLRLRARPGRRRRAPRDLHVVRGQDALAHEDGRRARGSARPAGHEGCHGAGLAHRAVARGRVDARRDPRGRTAGSPRCATTSRMPAASSSRPTRPPRAPTRRCSSRSPARSPSWCSRTRRRARSASSSSPTPTSAGWWRCAWCRRAWMCRASRSACTRRVLRRRCTSRKPSAASCGRAAVERPRRSSCRTCRPLIALASALELERDHALDRERAEEELLEDIDAEQREEQASDRLLDEYEWTALESEAEFDHALFDGHAFGTTAMPGTDEELDFIGLPGILEPDQVRELLRQRQARQARRTRGRPPQAEGDTAPAPLYRTLGEQRRLLNSLVGMRAKVSGEPHGHIHAELRRVCGGPGGRASDRAAAAGADRAPAAGDRALAQEGVAAAGAAERVAFAGTSGTTRRMQGSEPGMSRAHSRRRDAEERAGVSRENRCAATRPVRVSGSPATSSSAPSRAG